jgi:flavin-dependent dehydrogenase
MVYGAFGAQACVQFARPSWVIKRAEFDDLLLSKAKIARPCLHLHEELRMVERAESDGQAGFLLTFRSGIQLWVRLVLASDGAHSVVRKSLHQTNHPAKEAESIAIRAYAKAGNIGQQKRTLHLWFAKTVQPGYIWLFPIGADSYNVGVGIVGKVPPGNSLRRMLKEALADPQNPIGTNWELDDSTWLGHPVPLGQAGSSVSGAGYMLLGDAAHLVAPATGEGIGHAILSGLLAAAAATSCFAKQNFTGVQIAKYYDAPLRKKLDPLFARQRRLLWFGGRFPRLFNALIGLANRNSFLRNKLASL